MTAVSTLIAIGVATAAVGTGVQMYQGMQAAEAQKEALAAQGEAENLRQQSMTLDAMRKRREMVRQATVQTAQAQAAGTAQGMGQSSGVEGAVAQIQGQTAYNMLGNYQQEDIGNGIFAANRRKSAAEMDMADAQSYSGLGSGLSSLGGMVMKNAGTISSIG